VEVLPNRCGNAFVSVIPEQLAGSEHSSIALIAKHITGHRRKGCLVLPFRSNDYMGRNSSGSTAECVLYTPHAVTEAAVLPLLEAKPPIYTLRLIHGLHDVALKMTQQLNLGAHNGLKVQRALKPKYWFGTHDEVKKAGGVIKLILRRKILTLEDAIRQEKEKLRPGDEGTDEVMFEYVGNGESRTLNLLIF
jgi:hypothetical protein